MTSFTGERVWVEISGRDRVMGVVVEDFSDALPSDNVEVVIDRDHTAVAQRFAVALDDGGLVFVDQVTPIDQVIAVDQDDD
ncbi:hypothetical protein AAFP35_17790 [Gordonia sp. CPCC 206044]|uniref:hypothetical protein n=1 Tax=Gordonia sp. CPCC 206044 TaxID=3140793 RepID=UPI003AF38424